MPRSSLLALYTESPLHAGTGSTVSVIDLPIQRERITSYPHIYGSGIKGALRSHVMSANDNMGILEQIFGPAPETLRQNPDMMSHAGAVAIGEAKLVLFPVRSLTGIFAYATSPFVLARLARNLGYAGLGALPQTPAPVDQKACLVSPLALREGGVAASNAVVLEEYTFAPQDEESVTELANWLISNLMPSGDEYAFWRNTLAQRLVILPDDAFRDFALYSTPITTHIAIENDTKTVKQGQLWTQEVVPPDTLFVSTVLARNSRVPNSQLTDADIQNHLMGYLQSGSRVQIGGDETTGHGIVAIKWMTQGAE